MRLIVCSDSHGHFEDLRRAATAFPADLIIHLGDNAADAARLAECIDTPVEYVRGNCDMGGAPEEKVLELDGKKILITHGHRYHVKSGVGILSLRMLELEADAVFYGHTHVPDYLFHNRGLVLNPGAICGNRTNGAPGYAVVEWKPYGQFYVQMMELF